MMAPANPIATNEIKTSNTTTDSVHLLRNESKDSFVLFSMEDKTGELSSTSTSNLNTDSKLTWFSWPLINFLNKISFFFYYFKDNEPKENLKRRNSDDDDDDEVEIRQNGNGNGEETNKKLKQVKLDNY